MSQKCVFLVVFAFAMPCTVRTQPLTATGAPSQTSAMPCDTMPCVRMHVQSPPSDVNDTFLGDDTLAQAPSAHGPHYPALA